MNTQTLIRAAAATTAAAAIVGAVAGCGGDTGQASSASSGTVTRSAASHAPSQVPSSAVAGSHTAPAGTAVPTEPQADPPQTGRPRADPTRIPQTRTPGTRATGTPETDLSRYYGKWSGHDRGLTLRPDGTATAFLGAGVGQAETWSASWGRQGDGIVVTLDTMTSREGAPLGHYSGQSWPAVLQTASDGVTVLHMAGYADWCSPRFGSSVVCGA
ncbi:hypothetical protein [Gordonia shandongensis]|uniref:hypothetical protein n=1 Tax=Gordonia shandongensis TaxID=376351 RepID=UPI0012EB517A|nr:hypothetical protein [Gordonia shandongensis]